MIPEDLSQALQELPLFPLQELVMFPGALLSLHVFEPRYVRLVRDVLDKHRSFAIPFVAERDADMMGNPAIAEVAGAGTIVEHTELPGQRYHIVVLGRARVRLQELPFTPPYRRALATLLRSETGATDLELAAMHAAVTSFVQVMHKHDRDFRLRLPRGETPAGVLADACAHQLVLDAHDRQMLLETLDVRERVARLTEILTLQRTTLSPDQRSMN